MGADPQNSHKRILAALIHPIPVSVPKGIEFWSRRHIAGLILKHASSLPMAISIRVGSRPTQVITVLSQHFVSEFQILCR